jgi:hypothetical protein
VDVTYPRSFRLFRHDDALGEVVVVVVTMFGSGLRDGGRGVEVVVVTIFGSGLRYAGWGVEVESLGVRMGKVRETKNVHLNDLDSIRLAIAGDI